MKLNNIDTAMNALYNELLNLRTLIDNEPCGDSTFECFEKLSTALNLVSEVSNIYMEEE